MELSISFLTEEVSKNVQIFQLDNAIQAPFELMGYSVSSLSCSGTSFEAVKGTIIYIAI